MNTNTNKQCFFLVHQTILLDEIQIVMTTNYIPNKIETFWDASWLAKRVLRDASKLLLITSIEPFLSGRK